MEEVDIGEEERKEGDKEKKKKEEDIKKERRDMPHSTAPFYKEDDAESRRMMGGGLESLALGLGMAGTMGGVGLGMGLGMEMEMGMQGMQGPEMRTMSMEGMGMDMVEMGMAMDRMGMEMGLGMAPTAVMKEEEDPGSPSRERQAETDISASETTLALINVNRDANEPQFIFEFPGQDDEDAGNTLANLNSNSNSNINSTHNTTFEHETISPVSENNSSNNFISNSPLHSRDSYSGTSTYNTAALATASSTSFGSATLLPTILDEHHHPLSSTATAAIISSSSSSPLRPGSPTTESMRSMMSVFRVDPFASYDADAGSRRKRRKRGSSYAMLSDPEKTSREEPLMFTFQIEASPGSEYYENYENYHHHNHLLGGSADIAGPSSAMVLDHALSTPSPHSSPSINILPPGSTDYYHQPSSSSSSSAAKYNPYLQSAIDSDDFSNMMLSSASTSTSTPTCGDTAPISSRSTTAFSHLYSGYTTPSRQSHSHHQSFHSLGTNPSSHQHHSPFASSSSSHHPQHHHPHHHHQSHSDLTLNPTQDTAYMFQNMRQSMGMHLGNLSNLNVQGINAVIGMNTMSMPPSVAASLRPSYHPTATPPISGPGPSSSAMNISMPVQSSQQRNLLQSQIIGSSLQVANSGTASVNDAGHGVGTMQLPPPPPMDSLSVSAVSHLDDIIDHLGGSRGGDENNESVSAWSTPSLPSHSHSSLAQSHHQRHHPSNYHHSRYATPQNQSQNKNQGFGDAFDDRDVCEGNGSGGGGDSSYFENDIRKMRPVGTVNGKHGESLESGYPTNDPELEARPDSQLNAGDHDDEAEDITNEVDDPASPGQSVAVGDGGGGFQFGPLSSQAEIDAGGEPDGGNQGEAAVGNDRERNSKIRVGKLTPCRASSPLVVVALHTDDGNDDDDSTDFLKNSESLKMLKMEFGKPQEFGSEFKRDPSNAESGTITTTRLKSFAQRESLLHGANPGQCREDVDSEECNYECKNEPDSSFSYFKDDDDNDNAYSDVRKELFLPTLPDRCRTVDSDTPADGVAEAEVANGTCYASLKQLSSSSSPTLAERVSSYSYSSCSSTLTLRTAFRLNAAQFDLDLDFDPDFDSHSRSPSEAEVQDVDMIAIGSNECCGLRLSNGSDATQTRSMKFPGGGGSSTVPANTKVPDGDSPGESVFPISFSKSVSTIQSFTAPDSEAVESESTSTSTAAPGPRDSEESCRENDSKSINVSGHRFFSTSTTAGGAATALSLGSLSPQSQSQQAGPESEEAWKAFKDTTPKSTFDECAAAFTSISSVSQHIPHQIQSQLPPLYKLQIKNTLNTNADAVANHVSRSILNEYSHATTGTPAPGVEERIDYVHSKQYQDGTKLLLQATAPHSTTSPGFSFSSTGTGGSKIHICWICQKEFPRPSGLATHMNTHSGLKLTAAYANTLFKAYKCPIPTCSKTFAVRSNARRHLRIHGIGTNNSNLIFESSNSSEITSSDNSTYMYNNLHSYESSGPAYGHPFHPSSYYPSLHTLATSSLAASSSNEMFRTPYRGGNEQNRRDINFSGRTASARSTVSPPPSSLRHRFPDSHTINRKGLIQSRYHPYRKAKAYSHFPSPHLVDDCSCRTPLRLASLPSDLSIIPYSYSPVYNHPEIEPFEMYQLRNEEVKNEFNVVLLDDAPEENKMELSADSEWDSYGSRLQEPGFNVELEGNGTASGIEKLEELDKGPPGHDVGSTTRNFSSADGEDHYSTISDDISSVVPSITPTPTQRPTSTSTTHIVSRGGSISEIDTPTLSTVSTFSTDSTDLNTMAVASRWMAMSPNTETASDHDLLGSGGVIYHPIASLPPSSSAIAFSLSAYNLTTDTATAADRSLAGS